MLNIHSGVIYFFHLCFGLLRDLSHSHITPSESFPGNPIKYRRCRHYRYWRCRRFFKAKDCRQYIHQDPAEGVKERLTEVFLIDYLGDFGVGNVCKCVYGVIKRKWRFNESKCDILYLRPYPPPSKINFRYSTQDRSESFHKRCARKSKLPRFILAF